jgi:hypothetical protein
MQILLVTIFNMTHNNTTVLTKLKGMSSLRGAKVLGNKNANITLYDST